MHWAVGDDSVDALEFEIFVATLVKKQNEMDDKHRRAIQHIFYLMDRDGDQLLSKREIIAGMRNPSKRSRFENPFWLFYWTRVDNR